LFIFKNRLSEFQKAKLQYENIQKEKEERKQEKIRKEQERIEAIKKSKQERLKRIKKLTQKTKKGQPVMKGRIELLLEKIQRQVGPVNPDQ
jgi:ATPase subunit of ABC transporter with duplicated ATPase domains